MENTIPTKERKGKRQSSITEKQALLYLKEHTAQCSFQIKVFLIQRSDIYKPFMTIKPSKVANKKGEYIYLPQEWENSVTMNEKPVSFGGLGPEQRGCIQKRITTYGKTSPIYFH